jgi:hypothetical protein
MVLATGALCCAGALVPLGEAMASPGLEGTRNLSMGDSTRASSSGTDAVLINPAALSFTQQFEIEPLYQISVRDRTHGLGVFFSDSLNNPHFALAIGYAFMKGGPQIGYTNADGESDQLKLEHFGHEVGGVLSITAVRNWLYFGLKPKWQYTSLRYLDDDGSVHNARDKLNAFGLDLAMGINLLNYVRLTVVAENLTGNNKPAWTEDDPIELEGIAVEDGSELDFDNVRRVSDYPLTLSHGVAVFPLATPDFSINFDGTYDFTSFRDQEKHTRMKFGGSGEFILKVVPIRVGGYWDGRGKGKSDDRGYVSAGTGFIKPAQLGGVGVDLGVGFSQQVTGPGPLDTIIGVNIGIRLRPDL